MPDRYPEKSFTSDAKENMILGGVPEIGEGSVYWLFRQPVFGTRLERASVRQL